MLEGHVAWVSRALGRFGPCICSGPLARCRIVAARVLGRICQNGESVTRRRWVRNLVPLCCHDFDGPLGRAEVVVARGRSKVCRARALRAGSFPGQVGHVVVPSPNLDAIAEFKVSFGFFKGCQGFSSTEAVGKVENYPARCGVRISAVDGLVVSLFGCVSGLIDEIVGFGDIHFVIEVGFLVLFVSTVAHGRRAGRR